MPRRDAPGMVPALLSMLFIGAAGYGHAMFDAALDKDTRAIEFLLYVVPPVAAACAVVLAICALWIGRRARARAAAEKLKRPEGEPIPNPRDVAAGLIVQAIHGLLPTGDLARDTTAARKLGDVVTILEGAAALLERERDGDGDGA